MKKKYLKIKDEVYNTELNILICHEKVAEKEINALLPGGLRNDVEIDVDDALGTFFTFENKALDKRYRLIWINTKAENMKGVLAHELCHYVMRIFDDRGVPISLNNQEGFAYYYEFLFNKSIKIFKK